MTITVRISWVGGNAPQVDELQYPDGTPIAEESIDFGDGVTATVEVVQ